MSINPQTMEDSVLRACGRPHTGEDVVRAYRQAVGAGFQDINMDLIAGLPTDTAAGFRRSLTQAAELNPSNITVHTLALKREQTSSNGGRACPRSGPWKKWWPTPKKPSAP